MTAKTPHDGRMVGCLRWERAGSALGAIGHSPGASWALVVATRWMLGWMLVLLGLLVLGVAWELLGRALGHAGRAVAWGLLGRAGRALGHPIGHAIGVLGYPPGHPLGCLLSSLILLGCIRAWRRY
jgi:hypothetical protein